MTSTIEQPPLPVGSAVLALARCAAVTVLVVCFRLRAVRGRGHPAFRWESLLNTPLFVGFPGFVSKLWLILALVSVRGSIHYRVLPKLRRNDLLRDPAVLDRAGSADEPQWWRLVQVG